MHSAPLPHPFVRQSKLFSALPVLAIEKIENRKNPSIFFLFSFSFSKTSNLSYREKKKRFRSFEYSANFKFYIAILKTIVQSRAILTSVHRISRRVVGGAVALRLILVNPAGGVHAATHILARFPSVADAGLVRIAVASGVAGALKSVQCFPTLGVHATRSSQTLVPAFETFQIIKKVQMRDSRLISVTFLAVDLRIPIVAGRTRALRFPANHSALRVEPAHAMLEAGVRAYPVLAAPFVRLAVLVPVALQLVALLAWLPLEPFRAQANRPVIRHAAQSIDSTRRSVCRTRILALAIDAR